MNEQIELKKTLNSIMKSMKTDYPVDFARFIHDRESAELYRANLTQAINGFDLKTIVNGYETAVELSPDKLPSISDIARGCVSEYASAPKQTEEPPKIVSDAPKTELSTDMAHPLKLLKHALENHTEPEDESMEDRLSRILQNITDHEELISYYKRKGFIRRHLWSEVHFCSSGGCSDSGNLSSGIVGGGNFYCKKHKLHAA